MKLVSILVLATVLGCLVIPAQAEAQQMKCVSDGPEKLDMLAHGVAAGSTLLVVAEVVVAVGSKGRATAAVLAAGAAAYAVVKDFVGGKETTICTATNPSHPRIDFVFIGHGQEFLNATDTAQRLRSANIGNLDISDKITLTHSDTITMTRRIETLSQLEKLPKHIKIDDFLSDRKHISPTQADRITELFRGCSDGQGKWRGDCLFGTDNSHGSQ